jgi:hypothetical protein
MHERRRWKRQIYIVLFLCVCTLILFFVFWCLFVSGIKMVFTWTNHRSLIGPCCDHRSKCLVVDRHQKARRHICAFKGAKVNTKEMSKVVVGCCRISIVSSHYCELHNTLESTEVPNQIERVYRRESVARKIYIYKEECLFVCLLVCSLSTQSP